MKLSILWALTLLLCAWFIPACSPEVDVQRVTQEGGGEAAQGGAGGEGGSEPFCHELPLVVPGLPCIEGTTCKAVCHADGKCCSGPRLP